MKHSLTRYALVFGLLTAGLSFVAVPEATAKLSKAKVKRCLSGRFRVRTTGTEQFLDPITLLPVFAPRFVNVGGGLGIKGRGANFKGLNFRFTRISVRGNKKMVIRGRSRLNGFINNLPGFLKIVIKARGSRAVITTGVFRYAGQNPVNLVVQTVGNGRITGSKRLPKSCIH